MDGFDPQILQYALMAATLVKVCVDIANVATPAETPPWMSPLLALLLGPLMVAALMLAAGVQMSPQTIAQAVIAGVLSAGTAGVASSLQARTKPSSHATDGLNDAPPADQSYPPEFVDAVAEALLRKRAEDLERRYPLAKVAPMASTTLEEYEARLRPEERERRAGLARWQREALIEHAAEDSKRATTEIRSHND